jgi:FkbM family methyltransferase
MGEIAPQVAHYAFEPIPYLAAGLKNKYVIFHILEFALSDTEGEAAFEHAMNDPGYRCLRRRHEIPGSPAFEQITVRTARLDPIIPATTPVAFIKIDVEGAEYLVLRGAAETIQRCRPVTVFEAGWPGAGVYGVSPDRLFRLVTINLGLKVGLMTRWLAGVDRPFTEEEFVWNFSNGADYYFIAYA